MRVRKHRVEAFGALVAVEEPPALVAVDRILARRMGIEGGEVWSGADPGLDVDLRGPSEVHLSVTERCPAGCKGCYADATPKGHEPALEEVVARLEVLAGMGAFSVAPRRR